MNKFTARFLAVHPKFFIASLSSVMYGLFLAYSTLGYLKIDLAIVTVLCDLFLHGAINIANDYFDYKNKIDSKYKPGESLVNKTPYTPHRWYLKCFFFFVFCSVVLGSYLVFKTDYKILVIGVLSILATYLYSGGKKPLANKGFGEFLSFFFFGPVACFGTYYIQISNIYNIKLLNSVSIGLLVACIMLSNNIRDIKTDLPAGKYTLAIKVGEKKAKMIYVAFMIVAYSISVYLKSYGVLLSLPFALFIIKNLCFGNRDKVIKSVEYSAILVLVYSFLLLI